MRSIIGKYTSNVYIVNTRRLPDDAKGPDKKLEDTDFRFKEHGGDHDTYKRGNDTEHIPRHTEINETTAKRISKTWGS